MQLLAVQGTMGSGKTSLIKHLIADLARKGLRASLIVNEDGEADFEPAFVDEHLTGIARLRGG